MYLNVDLAVAGRYWDVGASPSLARFLTQISSRVQAPDEPEKVLGVWSSPSR
jgi:hypothetical protein